MEITNQPLPMSFRLEEFGETEFSIIDNYRKIVPDDTIDFVTEFALSFPEKGLSIQLKVTASDNQSQAELTHIVTKMTIGFDEETLAAIGHGPAMKLPIHFLANVLICALASTRGVLSSRIRGTFMDQVTIPFIQVSTILRDIPESLMTFFA